MQIYISNITDAGTPNLYTQTNIAIYSKSNIDVFLVVFCVINLQLYLVLYLYAANRSFNK